MLKFNFSSACTTQFQLLCIVNIGIWIAQFHYQQYSTILDQELITNSKSENVDNKTLPLKIGTEHAPEVNEILESLPSKKPWSTSSDGVFTYQSTSPSIRENAICISGSRMNTLLDPEISQSLLRYVVEPNDVDIFLYGYDMKEEEIPILFALYGDHIKGFRLGTLTLRESDRVTAFHITYGYMLHGIHECFGTILEAYSLFHKEHPYIVVMRSRPDLLFQAEVKMPAYRTDIFADRQVIYDTRPNHIFAPQFIDSTSGAVKFEIGPGLNDQLLLGSPGSMAHFAHCIYGIYNGQYEGPFIERLLYNYLVGRVKLEVLQANISSIVKRF